MHESCITPLSNITNLYKFKSIRKYKHFEKQKNKPIRLKKFYQPIDFESNETPDLSFLIHKPYFPLFHYR